MCLMLRRGLSSFTRAFQPLSAAATPPISWKPTGRPQQTLAGEIAITGTGLHSGAKTTARLMPAMAREGRYFVVSSGVRGPSADARIPAAIEHAVESPLCTTLCSGDGGARMHTVEHLLSAMEACGVDNCRIEIHGGYEVPILDGSAREWVDAIEHIGLSAAEDFSGNKIDKMAPFIQYPIYVWRNDSFISAFPSSDARISCGIDFPQVPSIGCQWFSCFMDVSMYSSEIAPARTFCVYEEVERIRSSGLIKGGTLENAIVCSATAGWLNPPLRFHDEPCRHKVLDLIGDLCLFARDGSKGLPTAHIIAYKAGHSLHAEFVRHLSGIWQGREEFGGDAVRCAAHGL